jgi:hypothetical protein
MTGYLQRARDSGRIAALKNIQWVLQAYNGDNGWEYPKPADDPTTGKCLSDKDWKNANATDFVNMFQKKQIPIDPQATRQSFPCGTNASYVYRLIDNSLSYLLWSRVETPAQWNYNTGVTGTVEIDTITKLDQVKLSDSGSTYMVTSL